MEKNALSRFCDYVGNPLRPRKHLPVVMGRHVYTLVTT
jgi:hypothetical protein